MSFLPIFTLEAQEGRLFGPLAFTKTFAMAAAALLSVTLVPALMVIFVRGRIIPEAQNPLNRLLIWLYRPVIAGVLRAALTILLALASLAVTVWPARSSAPSSCRLERGHAVLHADDVAGDLGDQGGRAAATQDRIIKRFPEVESVYGKAGRARQRPTRRRPRCSKP